MNSLFPIAALVVAAYMGLAPGSCTSDDRRTGSQPEAALHSGAPNDAALEHAFVNRLSNQQLAGEGTVVKVLPDDRQGSRHQRFIVRLPSGRTVLVSHNIDLAPRIPTLQLGASLAFYGEYEWNAKGGVVHWTHRDPQGQHTAGWIKHRGQIYQ